MRIPRSTGALGGLLIVVLGLWGGLIPFIGPYFHYSFGSDATWHYSAARLWLDILPGAVAVIGGLTLLYSGTRSGGALGGWLAIAAGAWFVVGLPVSLLWHTAGNPIGAPMYGHVRQMAELLGCFYGIGVVIVALAAIALGRFMSRPPQVVDEPAAAAVSDPQGPASYPQEPVVTSGQTVPAAAPADSTAPVYHEPVTTSRR